MKNILIIHILLLTLITACGGDDDNNSPITEDNMIVDTEKINRKVLVIGIDGFRSDAMQEDISPFIYGLSQHNNVYYYLSHTVEGITYSGPNWSSILTGVHMDKHNVTDNSFENDNYDEYPSFFYYIENASDSTNININTASIVNWTPINTYITPDYADLAPEKSMNDLDVFENAKNILMNGDPIDADILFLQFDELDGAGHSHGFSPLVEEYTNTINILDGYSEELFNIVQDKRSEGQDWLYLIVSDHGGEGTGHGDASDPHINTTIFFAEHPSLQFIASCCYVSSQADIASTILDFLGINSSYFNFSKDGNTLLMK